jgi:signal transduction histidine kinase
MKAGEQLVVDQLRGEEAPEATEGLPEPTQRMISRIAALRPASRAKRLKLLWLVDAAVVAAGVLTIALLVFSMRVTSTTLDRTDSSRETLASLKGKVGLAHVWLEEALAGDSSIDIEQQVNANNTAALSNCLALRRAQASRALSRLCARLDVLGTLARQRWETRKTARAGSRQDQHYDHAFRTSLALADQAQHSVSKTIGRTRTTLNRINAGIVLGVLLIFGGMTFLVGTRMRQLAAYNERLRRLDGVKDNLIASVSHELRTPLTSTIGFLRTVERSDVNLDDEKRCELIAIARAQAERLARLVDDLLFFAQVENGGIRLTWGTVDVAEIAEECVRATKMVAEEKGVALHLAAGPLPQLRGDCARIAQLFDNLVSNAIKFTPPGGRVDVLALADEGEVRVEVSDNGIGVPVAEQAHLFERFFRASAATENAVAGTGLGLPIAKAIVDAHDGEITILSDEGCGTTLVVRLPIFVPANGSSLNAEVRAALAT